MATFQLPIQRVRLFRNGTDQVVCIPREFELPGNEALIRREGRMLVIEAVATTRQSLAELFATWRPLDIDIPNVDDGLLALEEETSASSRAYPDCASKTGTTE